MCVTVTISHSDIMSHDTAQLATHMLEPPKIMIVGAEDAISLIFTMAETKERIEEKVIERDNYDRSESIRRQVGVSDSQITGNQV